MPDAVIAYNKLTMQRQSCILVNCYLALLEGDFPENTTIFSQSQKNDLVIDHGW